MTLLVERPNSWSYCSAEQFDGTDNVVIKHIRPIATEIGHHFKPVISISIWKLFAHSLHVISINYYIKIDRRSGFFFSQKQAASIKQQFKRNRKQMCSVLMTQ